MVLLKLHQEDPAGVVQLLMVFWADLLHVKYHPDSALVASLQAGDFCARGQVEADHKKTGDFDEAFTCIVFQLLV